MNSRDILFEGSKNLSGTEYKIGELSSLGSLLEPSDDGEFRTKSIVSEDVILSIMTEAALQNLVVRLQYCMILRYAHGKYIAIFEDSTSV